MDLNPNGDVPLEDAQTAGTEERAAAGDADALTSELDWVKSLAVTAAAMQAEVNAIVQGPAEGAVAEGVAGVQSEPPATAKKAADVPTAAEIRRAYRLVGRAIARAGVAARVVYQAEAQLQEAGAQVWPGANPVERKAAEYAATADLRLAVEAARLEQLAAESLLAYEKLTVEELRTLLRLAEWQQREGRDLPD